MITKCKQIPDLPILKYLIEHKGKWLVRFAGFEKLILAKMVMLIRRGLVNGCGCGCRGDFEITEKGEKYYYEHSGRE